MVFFLLQPANFPYKEEIMSVNPTCLVVIILLFISIILAFKVSILVYNICLLDMPYLHNSPHPFNEEQFYSVEVMKAKKVV